MNQRSRASAIADDTADFGGGCRDTQKEVISYQQ